MMKMTKNYCKTMDTRNVQHVNMSNVQEMGREKVRIQQSLLTHCHHCGYNSEYLRARATTCAHARWAQHSHANIRQGVHNVGTHAPIDV